MKKPALAPVQNVMEWNRRSWLHLSAGALLSLGLWPGCAKWADAGRGGTFNFIVLSDTHVFTPSCPAWLELVRKSIVSHQPRPEFCLLVGDLTEHGTAAELGAVKDFLRSLRMDYHVVLGNHDYTSSGERSAWDQLFPGRLNYSFRHRGWQFIGLDSTQGTDYQGTRIQPATLAWTTEHLPTLNRAAPTVLFTHFPLGDGVTYRPANADLVLRQFLGFNLAGVFNGHYHGYTERRFHSTLITTGPCCAISRENHDGSKEKGYFLCAANAGQVVRRFIAVG